MTKVYITSTPYHLLISIIKILLENRIGKDILIMYKGHVSTVTAKKTKKIFKDVFCFNNLDNLFNLLNLKLYQSHIPILFRYAKQKYNIDKNWLADKEIYIFNDNHYYGCLLNFFKKNYILIEDGLNCYLHDAFANAHKDRSKLYSILGFSWKCFGHSKFTKKIEVNDASKVCFKHPNIEEVSREQMFRQLREDQINIIADIFDYKPLNIPHKQDCSLLLTQPLSEDSYVNHQKKIKIYKYLVQKYAIGTLYIKAHPREKEDYSKIFPNAIIIKNNKIPIELFLLKEKLHFKRVITTFTTAIDAIFCADEKIQMGVEWTVNFDEKKQPY